MFEGRRDKSVPQDLNHYPPLLHKAYDDKQNHGTILIPMNEILSFELFLIIVCLFL